MLGRSHGRGGASAARAVEKDKHERSRETQAVVVTRGPRCSLERVPDGGMPTLLEDTRRLGAPCLLSNLASWGIRVEVSQNDRVDIPLAVKSHAADASYVAPVCHTVSCSIVDPTTE